MNQAAVPIDPRDTFGSVRRRVKKAPPIFRPPGARANRAVVVVGSKISQSVWIALQCCYAFAPLL